MRLVLGAAQFGFEYGIANSHGRVSFEETQSILATARRSGIDTLDTAVTYGDSEARLGKLGLAGWRVISKLPPFPEDCADIAACAVQSFKGSLSRLNIGSLYALLLHRPLQLLRPSGVALYKQLRDLKERGLVGKLGISIYDPAELDVLFQRFPVDVVQAPFNLFDRRLVTSGWLDRLKDEGVEIHTRSAFLQGLLLMHANDRPGKFGRWQPLWSDYDGWLARNGLSAVDACLGFVMSFEGIDKVVVGVDSEGQLAEIVHAADGRVADAPSSLASVDLDLIEPARWQTLR